MCKVWPVCAHSHSAGNQIQQLSLVSGTINTLASLPEDWDITLVIPTLRLACLIQMRWIFVLGYLCV
jgi:hypothetical protein